MDTFVFEGLIDFHSHLLPEVDDGCASDEQSVEAATRLKEVGFIGSICTPHVIPDHFPDNTVPKIAEGVAELRQVYAAAQLEYQLWTGGEISIRDYSVDWFRTHPIPTLAGSNCVLFDYWGAKWSESIDEFVDLLLERDLIPIWAHPERCVVARTERQWIQAMQDKGVLLHGNLNSIYGGDGPDVEELALELLKDERYTFVATDTHKPGVGLEQRIAGMQRLAREFGEASVYRLMRDNPRTYFID